MDMRNLMIGLVISSLIFAVMLPIIVPAAPSLNNNVSNSTKQSLNDIYNNTMDITNNLQTSIKEIQSQDNSLEVLYTAIATMSQFVIDIAKLLITMITLPITFADAMGSLIIGVLGLASGSIGAVVIHTIVAIITAVMLMTIVIAIVIFITGRQIEV